jgi:membrane protease YdiL (CAAX protease family)
MKSKSPNKSISRKSLLSFWGLVFLISTGFWLLGALTATSVPKEATTDLPISSLMIFSPITAALILVFRQDGSAGVKQLLQKAFDKNGIKKKIWYLPIFLLMPAIMILVNEILVGIQVPDLNHQYSPIMILVTCSVFFIAAIFEEVGWQGYAFEPMQARWNALTASLILGTLWAIWHLVPFIQMGKSTDWIIWQSLNMVATRVIIVWIYNNNAKSILSAILYHAMYNVSTLLLQNFGLFFEPMWTALPLISIASIVTVLWGPRTLSKFQFRRSGMWAQYHSS